uniref:Wall-associated receptor kinase galacturonan-binding domain-containing protein n=1 Tax=Quercus lobata TaxID=97700 RepID=A0A7N2RF23_QUELO
MAKSMNFHPGFFGKVKRDLGKCHNRSSELRCGYHGPAIRFPFQLKDRQPDQQRGYPGFDLYCSDNNHTVLELPTSVKTPYVYCKVTDVEFCFCDIWCGVGDAETGESGEITATHMLLGIWSEKDSAGHKIIASLGFDDEKAKELAKSMNVDVVLSHK